MESFTFTIDSKKDVYSHLHSKLRDYLVNVYAKDENPSTAAEKIGVSRQTLYEWRKKHGAYSEAGNGERTPGRQ